MSEWKASYFALEFVAMGPVDNNSALVQVMARRRTDDKPLPGPMLKSSVTPYGVTKQATSLYLNQ